jgi:hypothetical protein
MFVCFEIFSEMKYVIKGEKESKDASDQRCSYAQVKDPLPTLKDLQIEFLIV